VYDKLLLSGHTVTLVTCNSYICEFLKVQWLHFTGVVDKMIIAYVNFFTILHAKNYCNLFIFERVIKKIKTSSLFLQNMVYNYQLSTLCHWNIPHE